MRAILIGGPEDGKSYEELPDTAQYVDVPVPIYVANPSFSPLITPASKFGVLRYHFDQVRVDKTGDPYRAFTFRHDVQSPKKIPQEEK